jgi:hypothetical protein
MCPCRPKCRARACSVCCDRPRRRDSIFGLSQNTEAFFLVRDGYKFISLPRSIR